MKNRVSFVSGQRGFNVARGILAREYRVVNQDVNGRGCARYVQLNAEVIDQLLCYAELEIGHARSELEFKTASGKPNRSERVKLLLRECGSLDLLDIYPIGRVFSCVTRSTISSPLAFPAPFF